MKKKLKLFACVLGATATLAMAGFVAGCGVKDKFEQWTCDHVYNDGEVTKPATCVETGVKTFTCLDCGATYTESIDIDVSAHTYDNGVVVSEPTCVNTGLKRYTCVCGVKKTEKLAVIEHTPVTVKGKSPTCIETGLTDGSVCSVCDTVLVEQTEIALVEHTPVPLEAKSPTCSEIGLTVGSKCSVCDIVLEAQTEIAKLAHVDENVDSYCDVCEDIDFTYYQSSANYITEEYTAWESLGGRVARLHVASTADDGTVKDNSFTYLPGEGQIILTFDRERDSFLYKWIGVSDLLENDGNFGDYYITHDDMQYSAFEVDGEYYVDVYFADNVILSLCLGMTTDDIGENIQPCFENVGLGDFKFTENTYTVLLKNVHICVDLNADNVCDGCGFQMGVLSGKTYRMYLNGANYDGDESNGYEAWGGKTVVLGDVTQNETIHLDHGDFVCLFIMWGEHYGSLLSDDFGIIATRYTSATEGYVDLYFEPNTEITFSYENTDGIVDTVTFNTDNLRVKSGELVLVEETETETETASVSTLSLRSPVDPVTQVSSLENESEWTYWW